MSGSKTVPFPKKKVVKKKAPVRKKK